MENNSTLEMLFPRTRRLTVIAQDPSVRNSLRRDKNRQIIRARIEIPAEVLRAGPQGHRVGVVDYDVSRDVYYRPFKPDSKVDRFEGKTDKQLLSDPSFHCQNVYALVMRILARFEFALGRRVGWGFYGHHLNLVPHAFADANAFYSPDDHALLFGYFPSSDGDMVFTCLSHDVVVHEATHALLDGLRTRYTDPSSPDQAAFHEGFADVVALLSLFSLREVVAEVIGLSHGRTLDPDLIETKTMELSHLRKSGLLRLAEEMGDEIGAVRGNALRRSVEELQPSPVYYAEDPEFEESHRRGEILVAAIMNAFLKTWLRRLRNLGEIQQGWLSRDRVVEEGAEIADTLLTMVIRALDYAPPVHIVFGDFLSAALTSDSNVRPDDSKYDLRRLLLESFRAYGIEPASSGTIENEGLWDPPPGGLNYDRTHFEPMRTEPNEVFRFVWENQNNLKISEKAYSRVISVRPSVRVGPDGFILNEVVAEHLQTLMIEARELSRYGIKRPQGMPLETEVKLHGGGTLIFDEYGRLRNHIHNNVLHPDHQSERLEYLWEHGAFREGATVARQLSNLHRQRAVGWEAHRVEEEW